jgi:16S rRNA (uracil1498-N3)-methyltransferase
MKHIGRVYHKNIYPLQKFTNNCIEFNNKTDQKIFHYLIDVLRVKLGDVVILFNGVENAYLECKVNQITKNSIEIKPLELKTKATKNNTTAKNILVLSLIKKEQMDDAIRACTEIGIDEFVFVKTQHSQVGEKQISFDRLNEIAISASMQSQRNIIPIINKKILTLEFLLKDLNGILFFANELRANQDLYIAQNNQNTISKNTKLQNIQSNKYILIGPEGGFSTQEIDFITNYNFTNNNAIIEISLGSNILRSSTAAILGSFYIINK